MPVRLGRYLPRPKAFLQVVVAVTISVLAGNIGIQQMANGMEDADHGTITYVLLLNPECDYEFRDNFESYLRINNTGYEDYVGNYYVMCMGGVNDLKELEMYTVPHLRYHIPDDTFLFVYPESMNGQYQDYMEDKFGYQYRYSAVGNADIENGVAYAKESPFYVKHEMAHLATCGTWHDVEGNDTDRLIRHPEADQLDWCPAALQ